MTQEFLFTAKSPSAKVRPYKRVRISTVISLSVLATAAVAEPIVEGMSIVLPDDGWYQVQDSQNFQEICGGVSLCEVPAGEYIVINHTTGQRFENITVEATGSNTGALSVEPNLISWPDDGWYQVLNADTFESLCQGGRSCSVASGTYIVINLTTGQRWENVQVVDSGTDLMATNLRVERYSSSAVEFFWDRPAGAQSPVIYEVLRDGTVVGETDGTSFFIADLSDEQAYQFEIRQTGSAQGATIEVLSSDNGTVPDDAILSMANAEQIFGDVVAVINEEAIDALYATAAEDLNFRDKTFFISNTSDEIVNLGSGNQDPPYLLETLFGTQEYNEVNQFIEYSCVAGGGVKVYRDNEISSDTVFDDCVIGSNVYSGTTGIRNTARGVITRYPAYGLSITDSAGATRSVSGGYEFGNVSFVVINAQTNWRDASYAGPVEGGELTIDDYTMLRVNKDGDVNIPSSTGALDDGTFVDVVAFTVEDSIQGNFTVSAPWTRDEVLSVSVDLSFFDDVAYAVSNETGEPIEFAGTDPEEASYWQAGVITVTAGDGSTLEIVPLDPDTFSIRAGNGETSGPLRWENGYLIVP